MIYQRIRYFLKAAETESFSKAMENALCSFYEYPDELHEFFDAMLEYKLKCIDLAHKYLNPDVIHMHDDWGTNDNMFFSPELWREYIKPNEEKITQHIHELGMLYIHHSCGYIKQIIPDLVEIGVDAIEPMMPQNDLDEDHFSKIKSDCIPARQLETIDGRVFACYNINYRKSRKFLPYRRIFA